MSDLLPTIIPAHLGDEMQVFQAWSKAVGPEIARQTEPKTFRQGRLFVETQHSIWNTELNARRHILCRKLNAAIGKDLVQEIHFRQGKL